MHIEPLHQFYNATVSVRRGDSPHADPSRAAGAADEARSAAASTDSSGPRTDEQRLELDRSEQQEVRRLAARDREVRAHEAAHMAAGGSLVRGGAQYDYQRGPDGALYAVGGEVSIEVSGGRTPEETLRKAETVRRAALAPADPSAADRSVAAAAAKMAAMARQEMAREATDEAARQGDSATTRAIGSYQARQASTVIDSGLLIDEFV